uniref:PDZ domain-containing protein n=1 Tax=Caenorhabditis japonica TaxID=281687 RepID=A0A8R1DNX8_CAEJA
MVMGMFVVLLEVIRLICFGVTRKDTNLNNENFWYSAWNFVPISLELIYCTLFAIAVVSSLQLFHFLSSLGFFVHLFKKMYTTVGMFVLIFSTFWVTLSVIHVSLSRLALAKKTMSNGIFIRNISQDSAAAQEGTLRVGDRLVSLDGEAVEGFQPSTVLEKLKLVQGPVIITVTREHSLDR